MEWFSILAKKQKVIKNMTVDVWHLAENLFVGVDHLVTGRTPVTRTVLWSHAPEVV